MRKRDGLRLEYDQRGYAFLEVVTQGRPCVPLIFVDGFPAPPTPMIPGEAAIDRIIHPEDIGGVEIYNVPGKIPPTFARWTTSCGIIALWTRDALVAQNAPPLYE